MTLRALICSAFLVAALIGTSAVAQEDDDQVGGVPVQGGLASAPIPVGTSVGFALINGGGNGRGTVISLCARVEGLLRFFGTGSEEDTSATAAPVRGTSRLILLDEPFAGLDIPTARTLGRYLEALDQRIVHIAHDPAMLTDCDRVIWLEDGEVALDGPPEQVLPTYRTAMETDDDRSDLSD